MPLKKIFIVALALLAGCAAGRNELLGSVVATPVTEIAGNHSIFIATTRKKSDDPNKVFDGERSATLNYARVNVTVPGTDRPDRTALARQVGRPGEIFHGFRGRRLRRTAEILQRAQRRHRGTRRPRHGLRARLQHRSTTRSTV